MNLAYVTAYDASRLNGSNEWSGTGYHIAQALKNQSSINLDYLGPLTEPMGLNSILKTRRIYHKLIDGKKYQVDPNPMRLKAYANQIRAKIDRSSIPLDVVFSATVNPIAYLECKQPIVFWADATFANIQNFYPIYSNLSRSTIRDWHQMETLALQRAQLAIYSSDWAAKSAIQDYGADPLKVKVVCFGSNVDSSFTAQTIQSAISARPKDRCKLLFLGVDWIRKGGNTAYEVAKQLNKSGLPTELTIVGCDPVLDTPIPDFVKPLGFISKATPAGRERISQLLLESHLLILPTVADCTPIVFGEANALGVPCLSTTVGGVPTIVHNGANGQLFSPNSQISEYCDYITNLFGDYANYKALALSAFNEYESRLNWRVAGLHIKSLLETIL